MNRNLYRRWREKQKLLRKLCGMMEEVIILRPEIDEWGQRNLDASREVCRGWGYRYYKYERTTLSLKTPGQLSRERSERVLFLPEYGLESFYKVDLPQAGDIFTYAGRKYNIWSVQDAGDLYLTLVAEQAE